MPRITITVPGTSPQPYRFQLDRRVVTLGRGSNNDVVIDCASVSVSHAEMRRVEGGYELRDLDSTNGIKLDGERQHVVPLRSGLSVKLGDVPFDFQLSDEEHEALEMEKPAEESPIIREPEEESPQMQTSSKRLRPKRAAAELHHPEEEAPRVSTGLVIWFLILAAVAFFIGMAVRFEEETGGSWLEAVKTRIIGGPSAGDGGK